MTKKELMKKAHKMTKEIKSIYPSVDYKFQLGLCLAYLYKDKGDVKMIELKGTERQVKWANSIRERMIKAYEYLSESFKSLSHDTLVDISDGAIYDFEMFDYVFKALDNVYDTIIKQDNSVWFINNIRLLVNEYQYGKDVTIFDVKMFFELCTLDKTGFQYFEFENCYEDLWMHDCYEGSLFQKFYEHR